MKTKLAIYISIFFLFLTISGFAQKSGKAINFHKSLFTESTISKWVYVIKNKEISPSTVFKMDNGTLHITGASNGYLRTRKSYSSYTLKIDWRWTKTPGNSGVLVHIQPKDSIWPICYQVQQKANAAGDIICMNGLWAKECTDSVKFTVKKFQPSNEKPLGEWNTMWIICKKNTLKVFVNGELQNYITGLTAKKGFIGLQNEGVPIEFKNLSIK